MFPRVAHLREDRGNRCESCDAKNRYRKGKPSLEFAHIQPTGLDGRSRGQTQRYYDILRNPTHYVLICNGCHKKKDKAIWGKHKDRRPK